MTLVVDHLSKRFGTVVALDDLAFEVAPGQVFGFLGANGAGKTTTMRIALGVLEPDAGRITWRGTESHRLPRSTWGYLPEERGLYPRMRVLDQLVFFAGLHGRPAGPRAARGDRLAAPVPRRGPRRPPRRAAVQGQPAEDPVHRRGPPRPAGPADGRAVHGPRPGQRDAPARGVPRAPRPRPDRRLLDPPDGGRRGAVRVGRDRRPRPDGGRRAAARRPARDRAADGADLGRGRPPAAVAGRRARARGSSRSAWTARRSSSTPGVEPDVVLAAAVARRRAGHPLRGRRPEPRAGVHRLRRAARRTRRRTSRRRDGRAGPPTGTTRRRRHRGAPDVAPVPASGEDAA